MDKLEGKRIYLRRLTEEDATQEYADWINDPAINKFLCTKKATVESLKEYINSKQPIKALLQGIFLNDGTHIGNIKLEPINYETKTTTLGIMIGNRECWGKGYATEAIQTLAGFVFNRMGLETIRLGVESEHKKAIALYEKIGFKTVNLIMEMRKEFQEVTMEKEFQDAL